MNNLPSTLPSADSAQWQDRLNRFIKANKGVSIEALFKARDNARNAAEAAGKTAGIFTASSVRASQQSQIADALDAVIEAKLNGLLD